MIIYRFEIIYQSPLMKQVSDFMKKLDLGEQEFCIRETIHFQYSKEEKPVAYFKDLIKQALEACDCKLLDIEGGKIE